MNRFKLGCDPEMFLIDIGTNTLRSSIGLIGGSKDMPLPLIPLGEGYAVQEDNVAIEFNIPAAEGRSQFLESINKTLQFLTERVQSEYGFSLSRLSAASFPATELEHPAAQEFGCEPDFNAWTQSINPRPAAEDKTLRSCGGHVHVGFDKDKIDLIRLIQMMDLHLGVGSVLMDNGELRKKLYGKAGAFRPKPYGGEYRTLSNFWIFEDSLKEWVWDNTSRAIDAVEHLTISDDDGVSIVNAINNNDKYLAAGLVDKFKLEVVNV